MRILITGHKGFVGSHLADALTIRHDFDGSVDDILDRCLGVKALIGVDLKCGHDCRDFFRTNREHFDLVFHCAATVGGREGIDYNAAFLAADNFEIDGAMWRWALDTKPGRIIYFSSAASYPVQVQSIPGYLSQEDHAYPGAAGEPDESYGWVKLMGEMVAQKVRKAGVKVTIVRPFSSYGADQDLDYPFRQFIERAKRQDAPFVVWGDGTQVRDWIHIDDLVAAILALINAEVDGPVNLGTGVGTSMDELAKLCMAAAGYDAPIEHLTDKPVGVHYRVCDNTRLLEHYVPRITIAEGVRQALEAVSV